MFDLTGKTAIVTGGNSGVGMGYAQGLAKAGANVAIWARNPHKNEAVVQSLKSLGADADAFICDVTDEQQIDETFLKTLERFGSVDICFANAGAEGDQRNMIVDESWDNWRWSNAINYDSVFLTFKRVGRYLIDRGEGGKLIATSSVASQQSMPTYASYGAAKAAINSLVKTFCKELGPHNIQVNSIVPGYIESELTARVGDEMAQALLERIPSTFLGKPEHVEGIAVFLASTASDYVTGSCIPVDGGYLA